MFLTSILRWLGCRCCLADVRFARPQLHFQFTLLLESSCHIIYIGEISILHAPRVSMLAHPSPPPSLLSLDYRDHFINRSVRVPLVHRSQICAPLLVIRAAASNIRSPHITAVLPLRQQPQSLFEFARISLWPAQLQRTAICRHCAETLGCRLATAPVGGNFDSRRTLKRWTACIQLRVVSGLVGRIQVHFRLKCATPDIARCQKTVFWFFVCLLTRYAENRDHYHGSIYPMSFSPASHQRLMFRVPPSPTSMAPPIFSQQRDMATVSSFAATS